MTEEKARQLIKELTGAAYQAGMYSATPNSLLAKFWEEKVERVTDELACYLASRSRGC